MNFSETSQKARVVQDAPNPDDIIPDICKKATIPRSANLHYTGDFSLGSLLVDCRDISDLWGALQKCVSTSDIDSVVSVAQRQKGRTGRKCLHSIYAILLGQFTERNFAAYVSQANLDPLLNSIFQSCEEVPIDRPYANLKLEGWLNVFCSLQTISLSIKNSLTPSIADYTNIVTQISKHPMWLQVLIEETVCLRCGPLRDITTRVNIENINWFMNQIKLTTSTDLLFKLFTSPSVMGKCSALYSLLEIHGQLWKTCPFASIESLVPTLYSIVTWIFEKCKLMGQKTADGFRWVKAKFRCGPGETDIHVSAGRNVPETPADAEKAAESQASFSRFLNVMSFDEWFDLFANPNFVRSEVSTTNNCLCDAIHSHCPEVDAKKLRQDLFNYVENNKSDLVDYYVRSGFDVGDAERESEELRKALNEGLMIGNNVLPALCRVLKKRIVMASTIEDTTICFVDVTYPDQDSAPLYIRNDSTHWTAIAKPEGEIKYMSLNGVASNFLWKEPEPEVFESDEIEAKLEEDVKVNEAPVPDAEAQEFVTELESTEMGRSFCDWFKGLVGDIYQFFSKNPVIGGLLAFGFSIMSGVGIAVGNFSNKMDRRCFFQKVASCSKDFYYLNRGQDAVAKVFTDFGQIFRAMLGIEDNPEVVSFKENLVQIADKAEDLNRICTSDPDMITNDPQKLYEFKKEMENVRRQFRDLVRLDPTVNLALLTPLWNRVNAAYQQLLNHYNKLCNGNTCRQRPYCLWLHGRSNLGKSELVQEIVAQYNIKNETAWAMFTVSKGPEYLNGFAQERIILVDDFDSFASVEGCLDALLVMNMVTTAAYNPNIANLEDKNIQAKPAIIIICSNYATARLNCGINCFEAFERRRNKVVRVEWDAHKNCSVSAKCEHWKNLEEEMVRTGKKSFDHLTFFEEDPLVISHPTYKGDKMPKKKSDSKCPSPPSNGFDSKKISLSEIIDDMTERVKHYKFSYECTVKQNEEVRRKVMEKKGAKTQSAESESVTEVADWSSRPNVLLTGKPGTGKSFTCEQAKNMLNVKVPGVKCAISIDTLEEFEQGSNSMWNYGSEVTHVFFDDLTTFKDSVHLQKFLRVWKARHDAHDPSIASWILGVNEEVAINYFKSVEEYEVFKRRAQEYYFSYRPVSSFLNVFGTLYTHKDVGKFSDDNPHSKYVQIKNMSNDSFVIQTSLAKIISDLKPQKAQKYVQTTLSVFHELVVDAVATVDCNTDDFIALVNSKGTSVKALHLLTGGTFKSRKFSHFEIGKRIYASFNQLSNVHGSQFSSMDDFVCAGANSGFFDNFNDGTFLMAFKDKTYCLVQASGRVVAGIYDPLNAAKDLGDLTCDVAKSINMLDFLAVTHSTLPPWFILSMSITEQVLKILAAGAVIAYNIKTQRAVNKMLALNAEIEKTQEKYVTRSVEKIGEFHRDVLIDKDELLKPPKVTQVEGGSTCSSDDKTDKPKRSLRKIRIRGKKPSKVKSQSGTVTFHHNVATEDISPYIMHEVSTTANEEGADEAIAELASDDTFYDVMRVVVKNMVQIKSLDGMHIVHGIMLKGHLGTTVSHLFKRFTDKQVLVHDVKGNKYTLKVIYRDPLEDRADFELTNCNIQFADITKHVSNPTETAYMNKLGCLVNVSAEVVPGMPVLQLRFFRIRTYGSVVLDGTDKIMSWKYQGGISGFSSELPPQTKKGDCGAIMFLCDKSHKQKIVGMHVASSTVEGYFRVMRNSDYVEKVQSQCMIRGTVDEFIKPFHPVDHDGTPVLAKCTLTPFMPNKTNLYRSPFAYGKCEFEPSVLSPKDTRRQDIDDMLYVEAKKWTAEPKVNLQQFLPTIKRRMYEIGDYLGQKLNSFGIKTFVLNKTTALNSVRGFSHSQPIPLGTSAGYPFNVIVNNGKRELIRISDDGARFFDNNYQTQRLHNAIDRVLLDARQGKQSAVAFTVFGKDELLKPGKNTRTIAAAPLSLVIPLRMYFHTINAALAEVWNLIPIKVGIAPNKLDWHALAKYFLNVSDTGFSIDQKGFDFNIPKEIVESVVECLVAISECTNAEWTYEMHQVMRALHKNVSYFRIIIRGLVYQSTIGIASGHPGTAVENSIISFFLLYDSYCELAPDTLPRTVEMFCECVAAAIYGDDVACTVTPSCLEWFNQVTVTNYLTEKYKLVITNADKSDEVVPYYNISKMEFISRTFKVFEGYYVGPLNMKRLMKPLNFCHGTKSHDWFKEPDEVTDDIEIAVAAARSALDEMFFHGREQYEKLRRHLLKVVSCLGIVDAYFPTWDSQYDDLFELNVQKLQDLQIATLPVSRSLVQELNQCRGWFQYANRRCLLLGEKYVWDEKSRNVEPAPIPTSIRYILDRINGEFRTSFNQVLVNVYAPGGEIPLHKDNEKGLDIEHGVACLTIIGNGRIEWRDKQGNLKNGIDLSPDLLYFMRGKFVTEYFHTRHSHTRWTYSMTFRKINSS